MRDFERLFYHLFRVPEIYKDVKGYRGKIPGTSRRRTPEITALCVGDTMVCMDVPPTKSRTGGGRHSHKKTL